MYEQEKNIILKVMDTPSMPAAIEHLGLVEGPFEDLVQSVMVRMLCFGSTSSRDGGPVGTASCMSLPCFKRDSEVNSGRIPGLSFFPLL